jgi:hypothetical protein
MAVTPTLPTGSKAKIWSMILKSLGYKNTNDLIENITVAAGTPDTELSGMHDYSFVWDSTNNLAYFHSTGTTFTLAGLAVTVDGGITTNNEADLNGQG